MHFLKTKYHELHHNGWVATLIPTHELVCMHPTLKELDDCIEYLGLKNKVTYQKTWFRPVSKAITKARQ